FVFYLSSPPLSLSSSWTPSLNITTPALLFAPTYLSFSTNTTQFIVLIIPYDLTLQNTWVDFFVTATFGGADMSLYSQPTLYTSIYLTSYFPVLSTLGGGPTQDAQNQNPTQDGDSRMVSIGWGDVEGMTSTDNGTVVWL